MAKGNAKRLTFMLHKDKAALVEDVLAEVRVKSIDYGVSIDEAAEALYLLALAYREIEKEKKCHSTENSKTSEN